MEKMDNIKLIYDLNVKELENKLGEGATTNIDLDKIGKKMFKGKFKGVYSLDDLPHPLKAGYYIVNNTLASEGGEHWLGLVKKGGKHYVYDSFGRRTYKVAPRLVKDLKKVVETELDPEQKIEEKNCGQRCLSWLHIVDEFGVIKSLSI
jgi:hypothetical protein